MKGWFQTKNTTSGKFWRVLEWKMLVYFMTIWNMYFTAIWYALWLFGNVCGHLVYFSHFGIFGSRKIWQPCYEAGVGQNGNFERFSSPPEFKFVEDHFFFDS
jgi:hypothetical protein